MNSSCGCRLALLIGAGLCYAFSITRAWSPGTSFATTTTTRQTKIRPDSFLLCTNIRIVLSRRSRCPTRFHRTSLRLRLHHTNTRSNVGTTLMRAFEEGIREDETANQEVSTVVALTPAASLPSSSSSLSSSSSSSSSQLSSQLLVQHHESQRVVVVVNKCIAVMKRVTGRQRFWAALSGGYPHNEKPHSQQHRLNRMDRIILGTALPSMINLAVVPVVNSVDTFWVGRLGSALALAGQAAANQVFFTFFFLVNYLPTITAPLVATAIGSGKPNEAKQRVCESMFLCNVLGLIGTLILVTMPRFGLSLVLPNGAPALTYAVPYLRWRGISMIPALLSATGFAAFRGMLDTVTPLKVSLATNLCNLVLDPILMFPFHLGSVGAALATAIAETLSGITYLSMLLKRNLVQLRLLFRPPPLKTLIPLIQGGLTMLGRQLAINIGIVSAARRAQVMDPTGIAAAAYGIIMQLYSVGIVIHVAMQGTAAALVPSTMAESGTDAARNMADRIFIWGSVTGCFLGLTQFLLLPWLIPAFSQLHEVQQAMYKPAILASMLHVINGPVFTGEGIMLGLGSFQDLMLITAVGIGIMVVGLTSSLGQSLEGILLSMMAFCTFQGFAVVYHYLRWSKLAVRTAARESSAVFLLQKQRDEH